MSSTLPRGVVVACLMVLLTISTVSYSADPPSTDPVALQIEGSVFNIEWSPNGKQMLGSQPLAVLVEGTFPDTFEGREVPAWSDVAPAAEGEADPGAEPAGPEAPPQITPEASTLLLVGCAKIFDDNILAAAQNALLLLNAVDYLAGSHDLMEIRSKILTQRVIRPVEAGGKMIWRLIVVLLVPVILTIFGVIRAGMRRKDAARYAEVLRRAGAGH